MVKQIKSTVMSEKGAKAINAILLALITALMAGIFGIMIFFLGDFSGFRSEVSKSFNDLKNAQTKHVIDETIKNAEQDIKINSNTKGVELNKKDIDKLKKMGGL